MKRFLKIIALLLSALVLVLGSAGAWYVYTKQPVRSGSVALRNLKAPVSVQYDERGVPTSAPKTKPTCTAPWAMCMRKTACSKWK